MLENPTPSAAESSTVIKRSAPANQRNRSLGRRKSGDRSDRANNLYVNDGDKNQFAASRNSPVIAHGDSGSNNLQNDNSHPRLIALEGCSRSEASQLLNDRWAAAMHRYNDTSVDLSERPLMYPGSGASAWGQFRLPHQIIPPTNVGPSSGSQMDFLAELRRAMRSASFSSDN